MGIFIFFVAVVLLVAAYLFFSTYFQSTEKSNKKQVAAWRQLARANNLFDSIPRKSLTDAYLDATASEKECEEVERFAVQVGNDTVHLTSHQDVPCAVSSDNRLTENTIKILRRMFGRVEIEGAQRLP